MWNVKFIYQLKSWKFVNFEGENKYFYRVLQKDDEIIKEIFGVDSYNKKKIIYENHLGNVNKNELNNKIEGKGIFKLENENFYEDKLKKNLGVRKEMTRYADGDIFEGYFKDYSVEGKGILKRSNGDVYEGKFKKDLIEGKGIFRYANGDLYEGEFKEGKKEGKEILKLAYGDVHEGQGKKILFLNIKTNKS